MPLITSWANRGNSIVTDQSIEQRTYRVGSDVDFIDYKEVVEKLTEQWRGFNEAAASAKVDENEQPTGSTNQTNSWSMNEDSRTLGSYTLERQYEKKTTSIIGTTPTPVIGSVAFSVNSNTNTTFPFNVTLSTTEPNAIIRYMIIAYDNGNQVVGQWQTSNSSSFNLNVTTSIINYGALIGGVRYHKYVIVRAYAYKVLQTGTYEGPISERVYGHLRPSIGQAIISPGSNFNTTFPVSLTISSSGATNIQYFIFSTAQTGNMEIVSSGTTSNGGSISVNATTPLAMGWNGYHKYVTFSAYGYVTLDGVTYTGNQTEGIYALPVPTIGSATLTPAGSSSQNTYGSANASFPLTISVSGNGDGYERNVKSLNASGNAITNETIPDRSISSSFIIDPTQTSYFLDGQTYRRKYGMVTIRLYKIVDGIKYLGSSTTVRHYQQHL